jgi:hypothetical protein
LTVRICRNSRAELPVSGLSAPEALRDCRYGADRGDGLTESTTAEFLPPRSSCGTQHLTGLITLMDVDRLDWRAPPRGAAGLDTDGRF